MSRPSRRASQGYKLKTDTQAAMETKSPAGAGAKNKTGQTDLRSFWSKSKRDRTTTKGEPPGDASDSDALPCKKPRFWVEVPTFRRTLSHSDSAAAASSVTRSSPVNVAKKPTMKKSALKVESSSSVKRTPHAKTANKPTRAKKVFTVMSD